MVARDAGLDGAPVAQLHRAHVREAQVEGRAAHVVDRPEAGEKGVFTLIRVPRR